MDAVPPTPPPAPRKTGLAETLTLAMAVLALGVSISLWLTVRRDLGELRTTQRQLAVDLATLRGPTIDVTGAPALGRPDALVTLIEFSDYECPFCIRHFTQTMPQIQANFIDTGKIRYVFKDFPIDQLHPAAFLAHVAARCAAEQDKFWDLHRTLFSAPGTHGRDALDARAGEVGLDLGAYRTCMDSGRTAAAVRQTVALASSLGANGTPSFFIGLRDASSNEVQVLRSISGAHPYEEFEKALTGVAALAR